MTYTRSRARNAAAPPSPSMAKLHFKLSRIVSRKEELKVSFNHLKSQIKTGLLEAEDVFSSLAVPLMKLVGLKSAEMAGEGRSNTIFMKISSNDQYESEDMIRVDKHKSMSTGKRDWDLQKLEEDCIDNTTMAGQEIIHKQKLQFIQLVKLLKQVEVCVNTSQKNMFQTIDDHRDRINTFLRKAVTYISAIQQSTHDNQACDITLKILKALHDLVTEDLSSVEGGVDNLISKLTDEMCKPMIDYVKSCKAELTGGACPRLLAVMEDMREVASNRRAELENMRKMVRVAEERKIEALRMLKESDEERKKMRRYLDLYVNDKTETTGRLKNKLLAPAPQQDQNKDDKLLWELLKKKRIPQPESPLGPVEPSRVGTSTRTPNPTTGKPSITHIHRPTTRSNSKLKTHSSGSLLTLGLSPSFTRK